MQNEIIENIFLSDERVSLAQAKRRLVDYLSNINSPGSLNNVADMVIESLLGSGKLSLHNDYLYKIKNIANDRTDYRWHPDMLPYIGGLGERKLETLKQINDWIIENPDAPCVPIQERSLSIFKDEKLLNALLQKNKNGDLVLFSKIPCSVLKMHQIQTEVPFRKYDNSLTDIAVISENQAFYGALNNEQKRSDPLFRAIIWGQGGAIESCSCFLMELMQELGISRFLYTGDIDMEGMRILQRLLARSGRDGVKISPCIPVYEFLLDSKILVKYNTNGREDQVNMNDFHSILGEDISQRISNVFNNGRRIPQEALGLEAFLKEKFTLNEMLPNFELKTFNHPNLN